MNVDEHIAKLEALLARVRSRSRATREPLRDSGAPNGANRTTTPGLAAYVEATPVTGSSGWSDVPSAPDVWEPEPTPNVPSASVAGDRGRSSDARDTSDLRDASDASDAADEIDERTIQEHPVAENVYIARGAMRAPEPSQTRVIDPQPMEVIELDIDPDPSMLPPSNEPSSDEPFESRSRLVAVPAMEIGDDESRGIASDVTREAGRGAGDGERVETPASGDLGVAELDEIDEPAPSSSRRPISVEEKLKQLAEDDDSVHAAPPESGKLLAAPILNLDEPDVAAERRGHEERLTPPGGAVTPGIVSAAGGAGGRATPETARATLAEGEVAAFTGKTGEARAATFGELLDATMKL